MPSNQGGGPFEPGDRTVLKPRPRSADGRVVADVHSNPPGGAPAPPPPFGTAAASDGAGGAAVRMPPRIELAATA